MNRKIRFLVVAQKYREGLLSGDETMYKDLEIEVPKDWFIPKISAIGLQAPEPDPRLYDDWSSLVILEHSNISNLVGKLLTHIDATFIDQEQRKAQKTLTEQIVYGWSESMSNASYDRVKTAVEKLDGKKTIN